MPVENWRATLDLKKIKKVSGTFSISRNFSLTMLCLMPDILGVGYDTSTNHQNCAGNKLGRRAPLLNPSATVFDERLHLTRSLWPLAVRKLAAAIECIWDFRTVFQEVEYIRIVQIASALGPRESDTKRNTILALLQKSNRLVMTAVNHERNTNVLVSHGFPPFQRARPFLRQSRI